jgi:2-iminoacetate synthase ThiH
MPEPYYKIEQVKKELHKEADGSITSILTQLGDQADDDINTKLSVYITTPITGTTPDLVAMASIKLTVAKYFKWIRNEAMYKLYLEEYEKLIADYINSLMEQGLAVRPSAAFGVSDGLSGNSGNSFHWR